jgi:hypothetical protein
LTDGTISHDQITHFLDGEELNDKSLWQKTKKLARQYENDEGCLIFDDGIAEKAYMDENERSSYLKQTTTIGSNK